MMMMMMMTMTMTMTLILTNVSQSSHDSKTEQESNETDTGNTDLLDLDDEENSHVSTYSTTQMCGYTTKWNNVRTVFENLVRLLAGMKCIGQNVTTVIQCWKL